MNETTKYPTRVVCPVGMTGALRRQHPITRADRRRLAWLHEDLDGYLALWADEMTFGSPVHPEPPRGKPAFADLVRRSNAMSTPLRFDVTHLAVHGDIVLAEWSIAITHHRETGRAIAWDGMSVAEIRDGRITMWREYWNPAALA